VASRAPNRGPRGDGEHHGADLLLRLQGPVGLDDLLDGVAAVNEGSELADSTALFGVPRRATPTRYHPDDIHPRAPTADRPPPIRLARGPIMVSEVSRVPAG